MNDAAKIRGLRNALDAYHPQDPMRAALQHGINHFLGEPENLPIDNRPRDALTGRLITFRGSAKANGKAIPHSSDPLPRPLF